jgi:hypothetical protein
MGKLLEKVIAKQVNADINVYHLHPPSQFGLQPHHCAIDAVSTLVYCIQATCATNNTGALLLFNILGFFNNINPKWAVCVIENLGFPESMCH